MLALFNDWSVWFHRNGEYSDPLGESPSEKGVPLNANARRERDARGEALRGHGVRQCLQRV